LPNIFIYIARLHSKTAQQIHLNNRRIQSIMYAEDDNEDFEVLSPPLESVHLHPFEIIDKDEYHSGVGDNLSKTKKNLVVQQEFQFVPKLIVKVPSTQEKPLATKLSTVNDQATTKVQSSSNTKSADNCHGIATKPTLVLNPRRLQPTTTTTTDIPSIGETKEKQLLKNDDFIKQKTTAAILENKLSLPMLASKVIEQQQQQPLCDLPQRYGAAARIPHNISVDDQFDLNSIINKPSKSDYLLSNNDSLLINSDNNSNDLISLLKSKKELEDEKLKESLNNDPIKQMLGSENENKQKIIKYAEKERQDFLNSVIDYY